VFAVIAPGNLEAARETKKVLDGVEMAVKAWPIAWLTLSDTDD
jgi:hypothetical protein